MGASEWSIPTPQHSKGKRGRERRRRRRLVFEGCKRVMSVITGVILFKNYKRKLKPLLAFPGLQSNRYQGIFPWGYSSQSVKLTIHLHLSAKIKNVWRCTSTSTYIFMVWFLSIMLVFI
jgi:hypothetical protein